MEQVGYSLTNAVDVIPVLFQGIHQFIDCNLSKTHGDAMMAVKHRPVRVSNFSWIDFDLKSMSHGRLS